MKVRILEGVCQGHTMCAIACPEIFKFDSVFGNAYVDDENVPAGLEDKVRLARDACPEAAIVVED